ncbi:MAG: hypothetical protein U9R50_04070 [Campylobacterota bacterium]|nr:hypothetical protein [Campylobacterota bacterium]
MKIASNMPNANASENAKMRVAEAHSKHLDRNFTEKISKEDAVELRAQITQTANDMMMKSTSIQSNLVNKKDDFASMYQDFQSFLSDIGYEGKPIAELSQSEAAELISEDGIFGIKQTSERIANFVINGAGGDEDRLRAGREGMLQGFKEAEQMWGGELPEISQQTMAKAIEMVDNAMHDLGFSILNQEA